MLNIYFGPPKSLKMTNFIMPRPAPKTNFFTIFFHTIILIILVNKMTPCALLKNSFQKLKQRRSEKSSLFLICSKCTYIWIQLRIFVPNIRIFGYKYVYLFQVVLINKKQRRSEWSSLFQMQLNKAVIVAYFRGKAQRRDTAETVISI